MSGSILYTCPLNGAMLPLHQYKHPYHLCCNTHGLEPKLSLLQLADISLKTTNKYDLPLRWDSYPSFSQMRPTVAKRYGHLTLFLAFSGTITAKSTAEG